MKTIKVEKIEQGHYKMTDEKVAPNSQNFFTKEWVEQSIKEFETQKKIAEEKLTLLKEIEKQIKEIGIKI